MMQHSILEVFLTNLILLERDPSTRTVRVGGTLGNWGKPFIAFLKPNIPPSGRQVMNK